ncbi:putative phosphatidate phosphatase isoform X3 [Athalia rosae]|uniref:putative phosphatidate phosphatase isoform X3 n=1 Tax=Athalia rosae TaxID=37344 RepID=UPI0020341408|nr:putative phosphatidate phosphatase isoform X3 [Athalia rosae]
METDVTPYTRLISVKRQRQRKLDFTLSPLSSRIYFGKEKRFGIGKKKKKNISARPRFGVRKFLRSSPVVTCGAMIFTEFINARKQRGLPERILFGWSIPPWVWNAYRQIGIFGFGAACTTLTTDIAKYSIGRLRPHFRHVCNTDACLIPANQNVYVEKFVCDTLKYSAKTIKESRLSFPSGHSSFAAYTMIYLILYLQLRIQWRSTKLLKHLLQFIFFFMAWFTALSRVSDYKHHWSDVMVGFLLGVTMALVIANFVANFFKDEVPRSREVEKLRGTEYENDATQDKIERTQSTELCELR